MRESRLRSVAASAGACALLLALVASAAADAAPPAGLPPGAAAAALRPEPRLPVPAKWRFPDRFSRTSGTGRLTGGALEWTDWVYDAYGASMGGALPLNPITGAATPLTPARGQYTYPAGQAAGDGADIFRAAVGVSGRDTVWRVDWNTLEDPAVPIAEWVFDTDAESSTGASSWPAAAHVTSPGIERALVVSAKGAQLIDVTSGTTIATLPTAVDTSARSFVVRVPLKTMPVAGSWRIRLAAGLADRSGTGFAVPTLSTGNAAATDAPRVYNVTFRATAQEPPQFADPQDPADGGTLAGVLGQLLGVTPGSSAAEEFPNLLAANFWDEADQAATIAGGDVSKFSALVHWSELRRRRSTAPPSPKGWSARWVVNDLGLGQGVASSYPSFVGRVQPYAVYVPKSYDREHRVPFTWMLHSAQSNYLQYASLNPRMTQELCEARGSICATTNGFGGGALYGGDLAEQEVWQVWRQLALGYRIAPDRSVVSGYSAGGVGSFRMSHNYPASFSAAMPLDGGFEEACSSGASGERNFLTALAPDRSANVHWVPVVMSSSVADELSLYPGVLEQARRFQASGDRFTLFSTSSGEHLVTAIADGFSTQVRALGGTARAKRHPGTIDYSWCPQVVHAKLGLGPRSLYWLSGLAQRDTASPSTMSRVVAGDAALPERRTTPVATNSVVVPPDSTPMHVLTNSWTLGPAPRARRNLELTLTNVKTLTVDTAAARLPTGKAIVRSDGPTRLVLSHLRPRTKVTGPAGTASLPRGGRFTIQLPRGTSRVSWAQSRPRRVRRRPHANFTG